MSKRLRDDVGLMCFKLQIHSRWMMDTHWTDPSRRSHALTRSDSEDRTRDRSHYERTTEALHSSTTGVWCNDVQHSTRLSPLTIPSFSAYIHTL